MKISAQQYAQAWYESLQQAKEKDRAEISRQMLKTLQAEGRLSLLTAIVDHVQQLEDQDAGTVDVRVRTAHEQPEKEVAGAVQQLVSAKSIRLTVTVDPDLKGGMVVETRDRRWDLSLIKQLDRLKTHLTS